MILQDSLCLSLLRTALFIRNPKSQRQYKVHPFAFNEAPTKPAREVLTLESRLRITQEHRAEAERQGGRENEGQ